MSFISNKIFLISLTLSVAIHMSFLAGLSGIGGLYSSRPDVFNAVLITPEDEPTVRQDSAKSTTYNLLKNFSAKNEVNENNLRESEQDLRADEGQGQMNENIDKVGGEIEQTLPDIKGIRQEPLQTDARPAETAVNKEPAFGKPADKEKDKTAYVKTPVPSGRTEPPQTLKTLKEAFSYDIFWLGIYVGKASIEAIDRNGIMRITSQAHSAPFISTFYRVNDHAESLLVDGMPADFRIKQQEGKYRSDKETIFDRNSGVVTFFNNLKGTRDEHSIREGNVWDVISGFFYLRTQPLQVGKTVYISVFDSNKFYKARVDVLRREKIKQANGSEIDAIVIKPTLESEGLFQKKGDILVWLTDDEKRIPVRVETKAPIGNVVAELRDSK